MLGRIVQGMRRNRPGSSGHQHVVGWRRDHVIAENLPDEARAPKLIVGLKSQVCGEREAEVAKRPARQVGQRQPHGPGRGASRHPVAIQAERWRFAGHVKCQWTAEMQPRIIMYGAGIHQPGDDWGH